VIEPSSFGSINPPLDLAVGFLGFAGAVGGIVGISGADFAATVFERGTTGDHDTSEQEEQKASFHGNVFLRKGDDGSTKTGSPKTPAGTRCEKVLAVFFAGAAVVKYRGCIADGPVD